jgi:hypothetical protein
MSAASKACQQLEASSKLAVDAIPEYMTITGN